MEMGGKESNIIQKFAEFFRNGNTDLFMELKVS